jgi:hypothetical protein
MAARASLSANARPCCAGWCCMSFLSRKPARPGDHGGESGRDDEYDDYDLYSADSYQGGADEAWSPGEYFSPEGIKGRWAGEQPDGRAGGRGRRDNAHGDSAASYDAYQDSFEGTGSRGAVRGAEEPARGGSARADGYAADEYATGARTGMTAATGRASCACAATAARTSGPTTASPTRTTGPRSPLTGRSPTAARSLVPPRSSQAPIPGQPRIRGPLATDLARTSAAATSAAEPDGSGHRRD